MSPRTALVAIGAVALFVANANACLAAPREVAVGVVVSVDRYSIDVGGLPGPAPTRFAVNQSTKIMRNGTLARLINIRPGDAVEIRFRPIGDKLLALTVTAISPPPVVLPRPVP